MGRLTVGAVSGVGVAELAQSGALGRPGWRSPAVAVWGQLFRLEWTPCRFGGERPWLLCPRCSSRRARLYFRGGGAACRVCHGLAYMSQRRNASGRAHDRGVKLMRRLGLEGEDAWYTALNPWDAPKPHRMRWETYNRIAEAAEDFELARLEALMPGMLALMRRAGFPGLDG